MMDQPQRPSFVTDEHLEFLDALRLTGATNMFGARPYVLAAFQNLSKTQAGQIVTYWMESFSDRHK